MSFFSVDHLSAGYGGKRIIDGLSFSAEEGSLLGILGANGSGKTTLLKAICGILPHQGTCSLDGVMLEQQSPRAIAKNCSYIPQRSGISIDISALDVVLMGFNPQLGLLSHPNAAMHSQACQALSLVGLGDRANDNYLHLSEGQKQLCILARTLVSGSRLLLLDEPESALDIRFRHHMLHILRSWLREGRRCAVVALHDPMLALNFCDALLLIDNGQRLGVLHPGMDDLSRMEAMLSLVYGQITLTQCADKSGKKHLVMLKQEEAYPQ